MTPDQAQALELQQLMQRVRRPQARKPLFYGFVPNGDDPIVYWVKQNKVTVARFAAKLKKAGIDGFDPTPFYSGTIEPDSDGGPRFKVDHGLSRGDVRERPLRLGLKQISKDVGPTLPQFRVLKDVEVDLSVDVVSSDELKAQLGKAKGWGHTGYAKILKDLKKAEKADAVSKKLEAYQKVLVDIDEWIVDADSEKRRREREDGKHARDVEKRQAFLDLRSKLTGVIEQLRRELQGGAQDEMVQQQVQQGWESASGLQDEEEQRTAWTNLASQVRKADQVGVELDVDRLGLAAHLVQAWTDGEPSDKVLRDVLTLTAGSARSDGEVTTEGLDVVERNLAFLQEQAGGLEPTADRTKWLVQRIGDLKRDLSDRRTELSVQELVGRGQIADTAEKGETGTSGSYFIRVGERKRAAVFKPAGQEAILTGSRKSGENTRGEILGYRLARSIRGATGLEIPVPKTTLATLESEDFTTWGHDERGEFSMPSEYAPDVSSRRQVGALQQGVRDVTADVREWTVNVRSDEPDYSVVVTGDRERDLEAEEELGRRMHPFWDELDDRQKKRFYAELGKQFVPPESIPTERLREDISKIAILDVVTLQMDRNADNLLISGEPPDCHLIPIDQGNCLPSLRDAVGTMHGPYTDVFGGWMRMRGAELPFTAEALEAIDGLDPDAILATTRSEGRRLEEASGGRIPAPTDEQLLIQHLSVRCLKAIKQRAGDSLSPRTLARLISTSQRSGRGTPLFVQTLESLQQVQRTLPDKTLTRDHFDQAYTDVFLAGLDEALRLAVLEDWAFVLEACDRDIAGLDEGPDKERLQRRQQEARQLILEGDFAKVRRFAGHVRVEIDEVLKGDRSDLAKAWRYIEQTMERMPKIHRVRPEIGEKLERQLGQLQDLLDDHRTLAFLRGAEHLADTTRRLLQGELVEFAEDVDFTMGPPLSKHGRHKPLPEEEGYHDAELHWDEIVRPAIDEAIQRGLERDELQREVTVYVEWEEVDDALEPVQQLHAEQFPEADLTPKRIHGGSKLVGRCVRAAEALFNEQLRVVKRTKADHGIFTAEPAYPTAEDHWDGVMREALMGMLNNVLQAAPKVEPIDLPTSATFGQIDEFFAAAKVEHTRGFDPMVVWTPSMKRRDPFTQGLLNAAQAKLSQEAQQAETSKEDAGRFRYLG